MGSRKSFQINFYFKTNSLKFSLTIILQSALWVSYKLLENRSSSLERYLQPSFLQNIPFNTY